MARQRAAIAQETARQKAAELAVTNADAQRDKMRLAARTSEADMAQRTRRASGRLTRRSSRPMPQQQAADAQARPPAEVRC
jgi:hypothetical protein